MSKKILILGKTNSPWNVIYIENVLRKEPNAEIVFLGEHKDSSIEYYKSHNIPYYFPNNQSALISHIPKIRAYAYEKSYQKLLTEILNRYQFFDAVHIHYVNFRKLKAVNKLRNNTNRVVCSFWGSDLYRSSNHELKQITRLLKIADRITFCTEDMKTYFDSHVKHNFADKISVLDFGIEALDSIDRFMDNIDECKDELGIPKDGIVISVGYNGIKAQQHCKVIDELKKLPTDIQEKLVVVFPLNYGLTEEYSEEIQTHLSDACFSYFLFKMFMNKEDISKLRVLTDIFIHAQTTDALSASVQEYIYAKKIVINPAWIKYSSLEKQNVFYERYDSFGELPGLILKYCNKEIIESMDVLLSHNHEVIKNMSSWETLRRQWISLY